jgi:hypothetical protein
MGGPEGIVDEDVGVARELGREPRVVLLLLGMEPEVLEQDRLAVAHPLDRVFRPHPGRIPGPRDVPAQELAEALPANVKVLIVADRGFGDQKLYRVLTEELKFDYLIRFRGNIAVTSAEGETRPAADWVGAGGRPRTLRNAFVTADGYQVGTVVCVHAKDMKEPWCLAANTTTDTAKQLMTTYGKRWGIEAAFRDTKDLRFGMGMASIRVSTPERRDRLWLLNAFAVVLLTLLGAAGEALGYDRHLKSNTSKKRTHSLLRQGAMLYELIPMMPEPRLRPLVERFGAMLLEIPVFAGVYGVI